MEPYQWSCSALDTVDNRYTLPDVPYTPDDPDGFFANIADDLVLFYANDTLHIYPLPSSLNCNGTVTGLGYCYLSNPTPLGISLPIFQFYILQESPSVFTITSRTMVHTTPSADNCTATSEGQICCASFALSEMSQFSLPVPNFAFGILPVVSPSASLLAFNRSLSPQYSVQHYRELPPSIPTIKFGLLVDDRALPLFQFFISK